MPGIPGFQPNHTYPLKTYIEDTTWADSKTNLARLDSLQALINAA